jgi:hypothetical protein
MISARIYVYGYLQVGEAGTGNLDEIQNRRATADPREIFVKSPEAAAKSECTHTPVHLRLPAQQAPQ